MSYFFNLKANPELSLYKSSGAKVNQGTLIDVSILQILADMCDTFLFQVFICVHKIS